MHLIPLTELVIVFIIAWVILGPGVFRGGRPRSPFSR